MPQANLILGAFQRTALPQAVALNCLVEKAPSRPSQPWMLIARPGLENFETVGTAPIRALFQKQGLFDNSAVVVASGVAYILASTGAITTLAGSTITGDDIVEIDAGFDADGNSVCRVANQLDLFKITTAGGVVTEAFVGDGACVSIAFHKGYWLGIDSSGFVYWLDPAGSSWDPLSFAAADYAPDKIVAVRSFQDLIALLGEDTTEIWYATGNSSSQLEPYGGLKFDVGCRARATAVNCEGPLLWVDHHCRVVMCDGGEPRILSDNGLTEQIKAVPAADLRASFLMVNGHPLYVLTLGTVASWIYDLSTEKWTRADSNEYSYWRAHLFCSIGDTFYAADALSNQVWRVDPDRKLDGSDTFTMEFMAFIDALEVPVGLSNIRLDCEVGGGPRSGQGSDPLVGLQISHDDAKTFGTAKYRSLRATGVYKPVPRWNGQGTARPPWGAWLKFFISDPVIRRVSGVAFNVP